MSVIAKKWVLAKPFVGKPVASDFSLEEEQLPEPKDGEVLCEALYLSVDPYMRIFCGEENTGDAMIGEQIARVTASGNTKYPVGSVVRLSSGWRSHTLVTDVSKIDVMPDLGGLPLSLTLGVMGMPGIAAYLALHDVLKPAEGETVVVNSAAGAVGSLVGQIAKIKGCTVIGFAGTDDKVQWLEELGFDYAFNYKTMDVGKAITKAAPDGVHCYFDGVGGDFSVKVLPHMRQNGRVVVVGCLSTYNDVDKSTGPYIFGDIMMKCLTVSGFVVYNHREKWPAGEVQMAAWIKEGKIKYRESITEGFEHMPDAFIGLFEGAHTGKAIVKA